MVKVKVMGQANAIGLTSIEGSFSSCPQCLNSEEFSSLNHLERLQIPWVEVRTAVVVLVNKAREFVRTSSIVLHLQYL